MKLKDEADARENADMNELAPRLQMNVEQLRRKNLAFPSAPPDAPLGGVGGGGGGSGGALWRGGLGKPPARVAYAQQCTQLVVEYLPHVVKLADAYLTGKLFAREVLCSPLCTVLPQITLFLTCSPVHHQLVASSIAFIFCSLCAV